MGKREKELNAARASHAYARLLATIDTLDAVCAGHAKELEAAAKESKALLEKALRYRKIAKEAEEERDEMRQAVLELVHLGVFCLQLNETISRLFDQPPCRFRASSNL